MLNNDWFLYISVQFALSAMLKIWDLTFGFMCREYFFGSRVSSKKDEDEKDGNI